MTALSLSQAAGATGVAKITITGALKSRWHAATRKQDGGYEIDTVVPAASERPVRSLIPWRTAAEERADAELRQQVALAEQQLADLKTALDDMRAQRDAWQAMAQARIRPSPASAASRWPWLRSAGWWRRRACADGAKLSHTCPGRGAARANAKRCTADPGSSRRWCS